MMESLGSGHIFAVLVYWFIAFVLIPFVIPLAAYGGWDNIPALAWIECAYCTLNSLVVAYIMKEHLAESFQNLQLYPGAFAGAVGIACGLMLVWVLGIWGIGRLLDQPLLAWNTFPISEMSVAVIPGVMVTAHPIFGTLCLTLLMPFGICGLFYAVGFAPVCRIKPWLAYLNIAFLILLPAAFDIFWRGDTSYVLITYILRLPVHLIACWSYQKTDSVLAPIASLSVLNLMTSLANIFLT